MDEKDVPPLRRETAIRRLKWKRLPSQGLLFGVCAGVAKYIGWKPRRVRLALAAGTLALAGIPALFYLFAALAIPADDSG